MLAPSQLDVVQSAKMNRNEEETMSSLFSQVLLQSIATHSLESTIQLSSEPFILGSSGNLRHISDEDSLSPTSMQSDEKYDDGFERFGSRDVDDTDQSNSVTDESCFRNSSNSPAEKINFIALSDHMKAVFSIPYSRARVSIAIHKVENTLILDGVLDDVLDVDELERLRGQKYRTRLGVASKESESQRISRRYKKSYPSLNTNKQTITSSSSTAKENATIMKQKAFTTKQEAFTMKQEAFTMKQEAFTMKQEALMDHFSKKKNKEGSEKALEKASNEEALEEYDDDLLPDDETGEIFVLVRKKNLKKTHVETTFEKTLLSRFILPCVGSSYKSQEETFSTDMILSEPTKVPSEFRKKSIQPKHFRRVIRWQFNDMGMLLASDIIIYRNTDEPGRPVSLALHDVETKFTSLACLNLWLDNVISNVPETAICFHKDGYVQGYKMIKTEDLPSTKIFQPRAVERDASSILRFLQENCTEEAGTYWLTKKQDDQTLRLYLIQGDDDDEETQNEKKRTSRTTTTPLDTTVAMLCYRIADSIYSPLEGKTDPEDVRRCRRLYTKCIELLDPEKHGFVIASAHVALATTFLKVHNHPQPHLPSPPCLGIAFQKELPEYPLPLLDDEIHLGEAYLAGTIHFLNALDTFFFIEDKRIIFSSSPPNPPNVENQEKAQERVEEKPQEKTQEKQAKQNFYWNLQVDLAKCYYVLARVALSEVHLEQSLYYTLLASRFPVSLRLAAEIKLLLSQIHTSFALWMEREDESRCSSWCADLHSHSCDSLIPEFPSWVQPTLAMYKNPDTLGPSTPSLEDDLGSKNHRGNVSSDKEHHLEIAIKYLMSILTQDLREKSLKTKLVDPSSKRDDLVFQGIQTSTTSSINSSTTLSRDDDLRLRATTSLQDAYVGLGRHFLSTGRYTKAAHHFKQGIQLFRSLRDTLMVAYMKCLIGEASSLMALSSSADASCHRKAIGILENGLSSLKLLDPEQDGQVETSLYQGCLCRRYSELLVYAHLQFAQFMESMSGNDGSMKDTRNPLIESELRDALKLAESYSSPSFFSLQAECHYRLATFNARIFLKSESSFSLKRQIAIRHFELALNLFPENDRLKILMVRLDFVKLLRQSKEMFSLEAALNHLLTTEHLFSPIHQHEPKSSQEKHILLGLWPLVESQLHQILKQLIKLCNQVTCQSHLDSNKLKGMFRISLLSQNTQPHEVLRNLSNVLYN